MDEAGALAALKKGDENALTWFMERYAAYAAAIINGIILPRLTPADAEEALTASCEKFIRRFDRMESMAREKGIVLEEQSLDRLNALWDAAKRADVE